ncbi:MAG: hypothetical protein WCA07_03910 [Gloeobacterales cyanobacterium]
MFDFLAQVPFPDSTSGGTSSFLSEIAKALEPEAFRLLWKTQWDLALDGQVYATLANVGRGFALISLFISLIQFFREVSERSAEGKNRSIGEFIWPIIVIALLTNNASLLRESTKNIRDGFNTVNDLVVKNSLPGRSLITEFQKANDEGVAKEQIGAIVSRCVSTTDTLQQNCLDNAGDSIDKIVTQYPEIDSLKEYTEKAKDAISHAQTTDVSSLNAYLTDKDEAKARRDQLTQQVGFQNLLELGLLATALLAPLAVGLSILPVRSKPLYGWFATFFSLGLTKIVFTFSIGIISSFALAAKLFDSLFVSNLAGTFIPLASVAIFTLLTTVLYRIADSIKVQI